MGNKKAAYKKKNTLQSKRVKATGLFAFPLQVKISFGLSFKQRYIKKNFKTYMGESFQTYSEHQQIVQDA